MTEQEYKESKQLLADAPEECTHSRPESEYGYDNLGFKLNALSDLRTMVEQYERIQKLELIIENGLDAKDLERDL